MLKPEIHRRVNQHSETLAILALIGEKQGYDIWIGKREQQDRDQGLLAKGKTLKEYMTVEKLKVMNATNQEMIENIDLLWIKDQRIRALFEVESTTAMTSAVMRGASVAKDVAKFMVLPQEREAQFKNKMSSPLFKEHFENENWSLIFFDTLRIEFSRQRGEVDIFALMTKKSRPTKGTEPRAMKGDFSSENLLQTYREFVRALGIERTHVLGVGEGGGLAIAFGHHFPEHIGTAVSNNGFEGVSWSDETRKMLDRFFLPMEGGNMDILSAASLWFKQKVLSLKREGGCWSHPERNGLKRFRSERRISATTSNPCIYWP